MADKEEASNVRTSILNETIKALGNRSIDHGAVVKNMEHIAALWSSYLGVKITSLDVPQMFVLAKISRAKHGNSQHMDHYIDQCGYAAISAEIASLHK